jgi:hypothetical protein
MPTCQVHTISVRSELNAERLTDNIRQIDLTEREALAERRNGDIGRAVDSLVVGGDKDLNPMFSDRLSYRWDAYTLSPGPKSLLTLFGAKHSFGRTPSTTQQRPAAPEPDSLRFSSSS